MSNKRDEMYQSKIYVDLSRYSPKIKLFSLTGMKNRFSFHKEVIHIQVSIGLTH